jgi:hypothetical protein
MLKFWKHHWGWVFFLVLFGTVVWFVISTPSFQDCVCNSYNSHSSESFKEEIAFLYVMFRDYMGCVGWFLDSHQGTITALATVALVIITGFLVRFTKNLWVATLGMLQASNAQSAAMERSIKEAARAATAMENVAESIAISAQAASDNVATTRGIATNQRLVTNLQLRAYVFAVGIAPEFYLIAGTNFYGWTIRPQWQNSGATPTKQMTICSSGGIRDTRLPEDFDFPYNEVDVGTGLIAPRLTLNGGPVPSNKRITPEDIEDIQKGRKFFYMWGWAKYKDVFPDTPQHITKFCWAIVPIGNPRTFIPHSANHANKIIFNYIYIARGNCADEECEQQNA